MDAQRAFDTIREQGGVELAERLAHLDAVRSQRASDAALAPPDADTALDADVVFLGGGLSLLIAAELAARGVRTVVIERARAGDVHREWNASAPELAPLVEAGIFTRGDLDAITVARYREGICQFQGGAAHVVRGVLDHAIDAGPFLRRVRAVAEARGVRFVEGAAVDALGAGRSSVRVGWRSGSDRGELVARIAVDARGASSPHATADLVCPTVGGVMRGLAHDPGIGDILVTTEPAEGGRLHIWEGFPGRSGELTVYLFYYAEAERVAARGVLSELYARFFATLGRYKTGTPELVRPTFGLIPGWSRLTPAPRAPAPRIVLVGDAAARHSPLTFCGFGAMLRTFRGTAAAIASAIERGAPPSPRDADEDVHAWTGLLSRIMASGALRDETLNELLDAAFASLAEMGNERFAALLQDRMRARDFVTFLRRTSQRHPAVYRETMKALGPAAAARWGLGLALSAIGDA